MGGCGSGRQKTRQRTLVEDCDYLDIGFLSKKGFWFDPVFTEIETLDGKEYLSIYYNKYLLGPRLNIIKHIEIEKTSPYFGGERLWLKCPGCDKRVRKVYRPPSKILFKCRTCYDLMYQSQESNCYDGFRRKLAKANGMTSMQYDRMVFG
jgi:hypothetical protein